MGSACEYIMAEELGECPVPTAWIPRGNRIETASTRNLGVALELSLNITYGFFDPLRSPSSKVSSDDPIARFDLDFEMDCADDSCQLYIVLVDLVSCVYVISSMYNYFRILRKAERTDSDSWTCSMVE